MGTTFLNVIGKKQTYLNMLYLLAAFPLGVFYFVFLVTGISLGLGLVITLIGIPVLVLMSFLWYWIAVFERQLTSALLSIRIDPALHKAAREKRFWKKIGKHVSEPITWKSLLYLLIKYPLGILSFILLVVLLAVSISLIFVPAVYFLFPDINFLVINGISYITSGWQTGLFTLLGIVSFFISLHILNGLAYISGLIANNLLGKGARK